jgi:hypothetical protein
MANYLPGLTSADPRTLLAAEVVSGPVEYYRRDIRSEQTNDLRDRSSYLGGTGGHRGVVDGEDLGPATDTASSRITGAACAETALEAAAGGHADARGRRD